MTNEQAETIALRALQHITSDTDLLSRFLDISGLAVEDIRAAATAPGFWGGILDFLRQDEAECLAFASNAGISSHELEKAGYVLQGGQQQDFHDGF